ncbi:hypothetical protein Tco_0212129 [Tanacetum coccineum]
MTTLAEFMIIVGADNCPPMLEKSMYDSWKIRIELYMENRENGRMILNSVQNGPLVWPTIIQEDGTTRTKKYEELSVTETLQADCDIKATNITSSSEYKVSEQSTARMEQICDGCEVGLAVPMFTQGDDPISYFNKAMAFLLAVASSRFPLTKNQLRTSSNPRNQATIQDGKTEDLDAYDSDCDDVSNAKAVSMANLSNYGPDVILEEKLALKQQIDLLEQNLSNQIKEKESLLQTFIVFKNESKEKESKYMNKEIDLEKKIKELDNIVYKVGQYAQTVHGLTKPQVFYDNTHKQALGYQNPFYHKKAQRINPTLYDGRVISSQHVVIHMIDDEEILILEEVSRYFGKRFVSQQELSAEQAFRLQTSHPNTDQYDLSPVKIEAPRELPKDILLIVMNSTTVYGDSVNLEMKTSESCNKCLDLEAELVKKKNMVERDVYTELSNSFAKLEKHCISLELDIQLNQQIFQKDKSCENQNAPEFSKYFENNDLKAQLQEKDTTINKLRNHIKSWREFDKKDKVKHKMDEIETINIKMEHSVAKLLSENELLNKEIKHLKKIYKDQIYSIKKTRALSKEHCDSLIAQLNSKSMENADLKCQIQEKVFVTTTLQNELRRLKGKNMLDNATTVTNATTIAPGMFKLD